MFMFPISTNQLGHQIQTWPTLVRRFGLRSTVLLFSLVQSLELEPQALALGLELSELLVLLGHLVQLHFEVGHLVELHFEVGNRHLLLQELSLDGGKFVLERLVVLAQLVDLANGDTVGHFQIWEAFFNCL